MISIETLLTAVIRFPGSGGKPGGANLPVVVINPAQVRAFGMEKEEPVRRFLTKLPAARFEPASGAATLCGVGVELDPRGLAAKIAPVRIGGRLPQACPEFWPMEQEAAAF